MERIRRPFQGVTNIIKFNWHFYILSAGLVILIFIINNLLNGHYYLNIFCLLIAAPVLISLAVSFYVYDLSNLYTFNWLDKLKLYPNNKIVNINAGFDETSYLISTKYPTSALQVFDFYDPKKHTEVSIKRARNSSQPYKNTIKISTSMLPLQDNSADTIFVIFSAHEIRNDAERIIFFKEISRIANHTGKIIITEHLRDFPNFFAYNIGFFHFLSKSSWHKTFRIASLRICNEIKITPFITSFILEKNATSS